MSLGGLSTEIGRNISPSIDVLMVDGTTVVSTNYINLDTDISTTCDTTFIVSTLDGSPITTYSWVVVSSENVQLSISKNSDSSSQDTITVSYSPNRVQQTRCIIRLIFTTGINEFSFDVDLALGSSISQSSFTLDVTTINFGELGDLVSLENYLNITCVSPLGNISGLSFKFSSLNNIDDLNFKVGTVVNNGTTWVIPIVFKPKYSQNSNANLEILYDNVVIFPDIILLGSKASVLPPFRSTLGYVANPSDSIFIPKTTP
jgi:hypothetical protein